MNCQSKFVRIGDERRHLEVAVSVDTLNDMTPGRANTVGELGYFLKTGRCNLPGEILLMPGRILGVNELDESE